MWHSTGSTHFAPLATGPSTFCTLATSTGEQPHVVGVLYVAVGGVLYVSTHRTSKKARNVEANPRVAVCIPIRRYPMAFDRVNLRSSLHLGTSTLLFDVYGAPRYSTGPYAAVSLLGIDYARQVERVNARHRIQAEPHIGAAVLERAGDLEILVFHIDLRAGQRGEFRCRQGRGAHHLARQGADVLVVDRATFPREKVCGDGLTPYGVRALQRMGIEPTEPGFTPVPSNATPQSLAAASSFAASSGCVRYGYDSSSQVDTMHDSASRHASN